MNHIKLLAMEMALATLRSSINAFFNGYPTFTSIASLLVLPSSASLLLSQALVSSTPMLETFSPLLRAAAGFPASAAFPARLDRRASQVILPFLFTIPFVLTLSLLAKSCIALVIRDGRARRRGLPPFPSLLLPCISVLPTHLLGALLALSADSGVLALSLLVSQRFPCSLFLAVLRSVAVANVTVVRNMAGVVAAMENRGGCFALLRACSLVRGRLMTALYLVLPANLGMAAAEALFRVRVVREYRSEGRMSCCLLWEAFSIAYLHALLMVLDVIMECVFYEKCCQRNASFNNWDDGEKEKEQDSERDEENTVYFEV